MRSIIYDFLITHVRIDPNLKDPKDKTLFLFFDHRALKVYPRVFWPRFLNSSSTILSFLNFKIEIFSIFIFFI